MHRVHRILLASLVVLAASAIPAVGHASQGGRIELDDHHPLAADTAVESYETYGVVSHTWTAPDMTITIGQTYDEDTGEVSDGNTDPLFHYVRIQYNESIPRDFRIYLPAGYWTPHPLERTASNGQTVQLRPTQNATYTSITMTFDGETDLVFSIPKASSSYYAARDTGRETVEEETGWNLPVPGSSPGWNEVPPENLSERDDVTILPVASEDVRVQYNAGNRTSERWRPVPECTQIRGQDVPVCTTDREAGQNTVLISRVKNPPTVRWREQRGLLGGIDRGADDAASIGDRISDFIDDVFGDDSEQDATTGEEGGG